MSHVERKPVPALRPNTAAASLVALSLFGSGASACSAPCQGPPSATTPMISVVDSSTGAPICDATVLVIGARIDASGVGGPIESRASTLTDANVDSARAGDIGCTYSLGYYFYESAVFALQVTRAGYVPVDVYNVYITTDGCDQLGLTNETVVIKMMPVGS